jgi:hypothetical protein
MELSILYNAKSGIFLKSRFLISHLQFENIQNISTSGNEFLHNQKYSNRFKILFF